MLNLTEFDILGGCANSEEIFYFLFAEVNYGGQVVRMSLEKLDRKFYRQIEDEGTWSISVSGEKVAQRARRLVYSGLLRCWRVSDDPGDRGPFLTPEEQTFSLYPHVEITEPDAAEFAVYGGYDCLTFEDHTQRFGYGPHEFRITQAGTDEIEKPVYDEFWET